MVDFQDELSKETEQIIDKMDIALIVDACIELRVWFKITKTRAAFIRPDRYLLETATSEAEFKELIYFHQNSVC